MNVDDADSVLASPEVSKRCAVEAADEMSDSEHHLDDIVLSIGLPSDAEVDQTPSEVTGEVKGNDGNKIVSETPVVTPSSSTATTPTKFADSGKEKQDFSQSIIPIITVNTEAVNTSTTVKGDSSKPNISKPQNNKDNESLSQFTDYYSHSSDDQAQAEPAEQEVLGAASREPGIQLASTSSDSAVTTSSNLSSTSPKSHTKKQNLWEKVAKIFKPWKWRRKEHSEKLKRKAVDMTYSKNWLGQFKKDYFHHGKLSSWLNQTGNMTYSKNWLGQFKKDYFHHGKFNLDIQVFHLARLAEFYMANYRKTNNWTDCVRAHALYNSISCRKPEFPDWKKHAFSVQEEYLGDSSSFTFEQQQKLTASLKNDLEAIRNKSRENMKAVHTLVHQYDTYDKKGENYRTFFNKMKSVSIDCSDYMADFAAKIVRESVEILKPAKPPCDFEVVAIGSLARGEATPYSDLEYLFLVEDKSPGTVEYFESLAVTTYFQIANLGETKLSYMAIKELDGWFEDKAMNGFKIDGLSGNAGNIPTGNGSPGQHNHFIVTPEELGAKYKDVLDNPEKETALRGDITSMLTYLRLIYAQRTNNKYLLGKLQELIHGCTKNRARQDINLGMINTDVKKFNFVPDHQLYEKGNAADVKREIYRFPSILLLDIAVVTNTAANNSWESLLILCDNKHISTELKSVLGLLLASAAYMRLSAYLFHDSQDDRISVSPALLQSLQTIDTQLSKSQKRWFVPQGLFIAMCVKLIMLKEHLALAENMTNSFQSLALDDDDTWPRITSLYYSSRFREALVVLKRLYGDCLCDDPLSAIQKLPSGNSEYNTLCYISEILYMCDEYRAALSLYKHMTDKQRIADCYRKLGDHDKAMRVLESITNKSAGVNFSLGRTYRHQKEYKKSENAHLQALELWYADISSEKQYDYYGDLIVTDEPTDSQKISFTTISSPEERLSRIINSSPGVILCVRSLGDLYCQQGQHTLAESYYKKTLYLISELYGEGAAVLPAATALNNLGNNYNDMGQYSEAEDSYKQALAIKIKLSHGDESSDIADTLYNLGINYNAMGQYSEAVDSYKQALAIYRNLSQGADSSDIADTLCSLGINYNAAGQYSEAVDSYKQALALYRNLSQGADSCDIARTLYDLGHTYRAAGDETKAVETLKQAVDMYLRIDPNSKMVRRICPYLRKAIKRGLISSARKLCRQGEIRYHKKKYTQTERCYKKALEVYRAISCGADSSSIALTMCNLACVYQDTGDKDKAVETLREALDMYIRVDPDNKQISRIRLYLTADTGSSGVTDSLTTESTSNSDTQIFTSVTPTSSDTDIQSSISHTETLTSIGDEFVELSPPHN